MTGIRTIAVGCTLLLGGVLFVGSAGSGADESERRVQTAEVPEPALEALTKLAGSAAIEELAREIEHGHTFYEGSWSGPRGEVDALVTESGDLVEIEEQVPLVEVPAAARAAAEREAGRGAEASFEKKTVVLYEVHFRREGREREMIFTPDGRRYREPGADADEDAD